MTTQATSARKGGRNKVFAERSKYTCAHAVNYDRPPQSVKWQTIETAADLSLSPTNKLTWCESLVCLQFVQGHKVHTPTYMQWWKFIDKDTNKTLIQDASDIQSENQMLFFRARQVMGSCENGVDKTWSSRHVPFFSI